MPFWRLGLSRVLRKVCTAIFRAVRSAHGVTLGVTGALWRNSAGRAPSVAVCRSGRMAYSKLQGSVAFSFPVVWRSRRLDCDASLRAEICPQRRRMLLLTEELAVLVARVCLLAGLHEGVRRWTGSLAVAAPSGSELAF